MNGTHTYPINALLNLPVETLAHIFSFLLDPEATDDTLEDDCISASQVCLRWRQVALKTPMLWTRIPASNPKWAFSLLKRSANLNIQVEFYQKNHRLPARPKILSWLFRYRHNRIDTISLVEINHPLISPILSAVPSSGFPQLRRFWLEPHSGRVSASDRPLIEEMLQKTRHLRSLKLPFGIDFSRTGGIDFHHVTELAIIDRHHSPDPPSLLDWLNAIKNMTSLQILIIEGQVPESSTEPSESIPVVPLPHLQRISLCDEATNIYEFITHLSFSPEASLRLELEFLEMDCTDLDEMRTFMEGCLRNYRDVGVWQCVRLAPYVTDEDMSYPSFSAWHGLSLSDWHGCEEPPQDDPKVCIALMFPRSDMCDPVVLHLILAHMVSLMKCKDVEYLNILQSRSPEEDADDGSTKFVRAIVDEFGNMDSLRAISFECTDSAPALLKALSTHLPHNQESSQLPFKTLRTLQLVSYGHYRRHPLQLPLLFEVLRKRQEAGRTVNSVAFYSCQFPQPFFKQRRAMLEGEYRPWDLEDGSDEVEAEELQVHMDDMKTIFYFYNCESDAESHSESGMDDSDEEDSE